MKNLRLLFFMCMVSLSNNRVLHAGEGESGANFLKIPISARANAMAGSYTAMFGDVGSMEYNPAGLAGTYRNDINATYQVFFEETSLVSLSIASPISIRNDSKFSSDSAPFIPKDKVFFGVHYRLMSTEDTARDDIGSKGSDFSVRDQLIQGTLAYAPFDQAALGLSAKYIGQKIADESANTFAFDAGIIFMVNDRLSLGGSVMNIGQGKAFIEEQDDLPTTVRGGLKWDALRRISILADYAMSQDGISRPSMGTEFTLDPRFKIRAGVASAASTLEYTMGFGLALKPGTIQQAPAPRVEQTDLRKKTLDDLDGWSTPSSPRPRNLDLEFGLDYAARFHEFLGFTHAFTFRILF